MKRAVWHSNCDLRDVHQIRRCVAFRRLSVNLERKSQGFKCQSGNNKVRDCKRCVNFPNERPYWSSFHIFCLSEPTRVEFSLRLCIHKCSRQDNKIVLQNNENIQMKAAITGGVCWFNMGLLTYWISAREQKYKFKWRNTFSSHRFCVVFIKSCKYLRAKRYFLSAFWERFPSKLPSTASLDACNSKLQNK